MNGHEKCWQLSSLQRFVRKACTHVQAFCISTNDTCIDRLGCVQIPSTADFALTSDFLVSGCGQGNCCKLLKKSHNAVRQDLKLIRDLVTDLSKSVGVACSKHREKLLTPCDPICATQIYPTTCQIEPCNWRNSRSHTQSQLCRILGLNMEEDGLIDFTIFSFYLFPLPVGTIQHSHRYPEWYRGFNKQCHRASALSAGRRN